MFYANDSSGYRTHINDVVSDEQYKCPACNREMIKKRGNINAHHFAHKVGKHCDSWYTGKLSPWHAKMQNLFDRKYQEKIIRLGDVKEFHIADIAFQLDGKKYVIEFQHSTMSQTEFSKRTQFYIDCGYIIIWVFDFCHCRNPKRILSTGLNHDGDLTHFVWPGRDRVKFLDFIKHDWLGNFLIYFQVNTGEGIECIHDPDGYDSWTTWEYINPTQKTIKFISPNFGSLNSLSDFWATVDSEEDFYGMLRNLNLMANP